MIRLTTSDHQTDVDVAYELGASAFLVKPIDQHSLLNLAARIRQFWFQLARFPSARRPLLD